MTNIHEKARAARRTLAELTEQRDRVAERLAAIDIEREKIAHSALTGNAKAREVLSVLRCEAADLTDRAKDLAAAIMQADRDVDAAEAAQEALRRRQEAERWLDQADQLDAAGRAAQEAVTALVESIGQIKLIAGDLRASGGIAVADRHLQIMIQRSIQSHLIGARLAEATIPAGERRELASLIAEYAQGVRHNSRGRINAADDVLGTSKKGRAA